jgi:hypothetical protein
MRGELNGLQDLFLQECPYAYNVHCYAYRFQLALVDTSSEVVPISQFFQKLIFVINTADSSSKCHDFSDGFVVLVLDWIGWPVVATTHFTFSFTNVLLSI